MGMGIGSRKKIQPLEQSGYVLRTHPRSRMSRPMPVHSNVCPQQCLSTANNGFAIFNHVDAEVEGLIDEGVNGADNRGG